MVSTRELVDLIDNEGSLEYLLLHYGLTPEELEDAHLASLIEEMLPLLKEVNEHIERVRVQMEAEDV